MDLNTLHSIHKELTKHNIYITESFEIDGYSNSAQSLEVRFQAFLKKSGMGENYKNLNKLKPKLKKIQSQCEKNNDFSKKMVSMSRPESIVFLVNAYKRCGIFVTDFITSDYNSANNLNTSIKNIKKIMDDVDEQCDDIFSYKDDFAVHFVVRECLKLLAVLEKSSDFSKMVEKWTYAIIEDESELNTYRKLDCADIDSDDYDEERIALISRKLNEGRPILYKYFLLTTKIYNKIFSMVNQHVDSLMDELND